MRSLIAAVILCAAPFVALAESMPAPQPGSPQGAAYLPDGIPADAGRSGQSRASGWVWLVPNYCWGRPSAGGPVTRLVATNGAWIETMDGQVSNGMVSICVAGRAFSTFISQDASGALSWSDLVLPAR